MGTGLENLNFLLAKPTGTKPVIDMNQVRFGPTLASFFTSEEFLGNQDSFSRRSEERRKHFGTMKYTEAVGSKETNGDYSAVARHSNGESNYGKYQLSTKELKAQGFIDKDGKWTGYLGINSEEDFLNNKRIKHDNKSQGVQDFAMDEGTKRDWANIKERGLDQYIGQVVNGITITKASLLAGNFMGGTGSLERFLKEGKDPLASDGRTSISGYMYELQDAHTEHMN